MNIKDLIERQNRAFRSLRTIQDKRAALENVIYALPSESGRRNCQEDIRIMSGREEDLMDDIRERGQRIAALSATAG